MSDGASRPCRIVRWVAGMLFPNGISGWPLNKSDRNRARSMVSVINLVLFLITIGLWWLGDWVIHWIARMTA
jgi:O-antigen/teichoic acid export membrane protein